MRLRGLHHGRHLFSQQEHRETGLIYRREAAQLAILEHPRSDLQSIRRCLRCEIQLQLAAHTRPPAIDGIRLV